MAVNQGIQEQKARRVLMDGLQLGLKVLVMVAGVLVGGLIMAVIDGLIGFRYQDNLEIIEVHQICTMLYGYWGISLIVKTIKDVK